MRYKNYFVMFCFCVTFALTLPSTVLAKGNDASKLEQLIVLSGFQRQFDALPEFMGAMFAARLSKDKNATSEQGAKVRTIITQTFDVSKMSNAYTKELDRGLAPEELDAVLAWLNSPLGTKIVHLESSIESGEAYKEMQALALKAAGDPAFVPRQKILAELDGAAHLSDARVQMKREVLMAMARFSDLLNGQKFSSDKELTERFAKQDDVMKTAARREVFMSGLYIYRTLSNEELNQYLEFYKSPAGTKYAVIFRKSFADIFADSLHATVKRISEEAMGNMSIAPTVAQ